MRIWGIRCSLSAGIGSIDGKPAGEGSVAGEFLQIGIEPVAVGYREAVGGAFVDF